MNQEQKIERMKELIELLNRAGRAQAPHGNPDIRMCKNRRVIDSIPYKRQLLILHMAFHKFSDLLYLFLRHQACIYIIQL